MNDDKAEITYVGDYSGLDCHELRAKIVRGVPFRAPVEWCARQIALRRAQWECTDERVIAAAAPLLEEEAAKVADYQARVIEEQKRPEPPAWVDPSPPNDEAEP